MSLYLQFFNYKIFFKSCRECYMSISDSSMSSNNILITAIRVQCIKP